MNATETVVYDDTPGTVGPDGAVERISRILQDAGLDAAGELHREALDLARQGLYSAARDRLRILLCLDPDDGHAHLLLAKVFAAQHRWADALTEMDAARAARVQVPPSFQAEVEDGLAAERNSPEVAAQRTASREQAELRSLRDETRRLRAENTRLLRERNHFRTRATHWSAGSAVLAGVALVLLAVTWLSPDHPAAPATAQSTAEAGVEVSTAALEVAEAPAAVAEPVAAPEAAAVAEAPASEAPTAPVVEAPAAPAAPKRRVHTVKTGDTLSAIAHRYYGDSSLWPRIKKANPTRIGKNDSLSLGAELVIP